MFSGSFLLISYSLTIASTKEEDGGSSNSLASYLNHIIFPDKVRSEMSVHELMQLKHAFANKAFFAVFDSSEHFVPLLRSKLPISTFQNL